MDSRAKTVSIEFETSPPDQIERRCGFCEVEVALEAGDVTYGGDWYHAACWILAEPGLRTTARRAPRIPA